MEQITLWQYMKAQEHGPGPPEAGEDLPGFAEVRENLRRKGLPFAWVDKVVTPGEPGAVFIEKGIPFERSDCPEYEGIWLCGGFSSVKCRAHASLLPGMIWDTTCSKDPERCPFRQMAGKLPANEIGGDRYE